MKFFKRIVLTLLILTLVFTSGVFSRPQSVQAAQTEKTGYVNYTYLNLRSGPGTGYKLIVKLSKNDKVVIHSTTSNKWYKVTAAHSGKSYNGYVASNYITVNKDTTSGSSSAGTSSEKTGYVNHAYLHLRSGAGTGYKLVITLSKNDKVVIHSTTSNKWYKVTATHSGKSYNGYVASNYITVNKTNSTGSSSSKASSGSASSGSASGKKIIYLTFDDGPGKYTDKLLNILAKYNVKATFFVTNQFPKYQDEIKKEYDQGHTVAIHTYSHDYSIYKSESAYYNDLNKISDICLKQTGVRPTILRFPGGSSNTVSKKYCKGIMSTLTKSVVKKGYVYADWNVSSGDAGETDTAEGVAANVIAGIKKHDVSVVLQHDIKSYSVDAVEQIIKWGQANGYTFKAMTNDSYMAHHSVNN